MLWRTSFRSEISQPLTSRGTSKIGQIPNNLFSWRQLITHFSRCSKKLTFYLWLLKTPLFTVSASRVWKKRLADSTAEKRLSGERRERLLIIHSASLNVRIRFGIFRVRCYALVLENRKINLFKPGQPTDISFGALKSRLRRFLRSFVGIHSGKSKKNYNRVTHHLPHRKLSGSSIN